MSGLNARTASFIALLLDVSGKARPADIQGLSLPEATEALRAYASEHPELRLTFDGDALVPIPAAGVAPAPAAPVAPPADDMFEFGPGDASPAPGPSPSTLPEPSASPLFDEAPAPVPAPVGVPSPFDFTPVPEDPAGDSPAAPSPGDFIDLPPLEGAGDASEAKQRVPIYWWLIAGLVGLLGGVVGFFALRGGNPRGARNVLMVGVLSTVLAIVAAVAIVALGLGAFLGIAGQEITPTTPPAVSAPAASQPSTESGDASASAGATDTP